MIVTIWVFEVLGRMRRVEAGVSIPQAVREQTGFLVLQEVVVEEEHILDVSHGEDILFALCFVDEAHYFWVVERELVLGSLMEKSLVVLGRPGIL